jgi:hypothetical protein
VPSCRIMCSWRPGRKLNFLPATHGGQREICPASMAAGQIPSKPSKLPVICAPLAVRPFGTSEVDGPRSIGESSRYSQKKRQSVGSEVAHRRDVGEMFARTGMRTNATSNEAASCRSSRSGSPTRYASPKPPCIANRLDLNLPLSLGWALINPMPYAIASSPRIASGGGPHCTACIRSGRRLRSLGDSSRQVRRLSAASRSCKWSRVFLRRRSPCAI